MKVKKKEIDLKEHLKRMFNKAYIMEWTIGQIHSKIEGIVDEHLREKDAEIAGLQSLEETLEEEIKTRDARIRELEDKEG